MIRVLVAGSSPVTRAGLEGIVHSDNSLELVGSVPSGNVTESVEERTPDVVLLEVAGFDEPWAQALGGLGVPVVLLTEFQDGGLLGAALRRHVRAVLALDASHSEILAAVLAAAAGLYVFQRQSLDLLTSDSRPLTATLDEALSPRELEVLAMLAEGLSNKLIAHRLGISEHTVKFHVAAVMAKLHAGSRTDAVMLGIRRGLVIV
jgi:two-component system, NarL family, response regulator YdfI